MVKKDCKGLPLPSAYVVVVVDDLAAGGERGLDVEDVVDGLQDVLCLCLRATERDGHRLLRIRHRDDARTVALKRLQYSIRPTPRMSQVTVYCLTRVKPVPAWSKHSCTRSSPSGFVAPISETTCVLAKASE